MIFLRTFVVLILGVACVLMILLLGVGCVDGGLDEWYLYMVDLVMQWSSLPCDEMP